MQKFKTTIIYIYLGKSHKPQELLSNMLPPLPEEDLGHDLLLFP